MKTFFWAYAIDRNNRAVLVRCADQETLGEERQRLKMSNAVTVGGIYIRQTEQDARRLIKDRGWKVTTVRDPGSFAIHTRTGGPT